MIATVSRRRTQPAPVNALRTYTTTFPGTENPISEGGNWINGAADGTDWGNMRTTGGNAVGTLATSFHDNTALITGAWAANQYVESVVYKASPDFDHFPEVEHRLRSTITPGVNSGYEVAYGLRGGADSYLIIVRWNGAVSDFTVFVDNVGSTWAVANGDTIRSEISGNVITTYVNSVQKGTFDLTGSGTIFATGAPGMGTNADTGGGAFLDQYGWASLTAGDL